VNKNDVGHFVSIAILTGIAVPKSIVTPVILVLYFIMWLLNEINHPQALDTDTENNEMHTEKHKTRKLIKPVQQLEQLNNC